jgi:Flp pilus assembly protein TadG
MKVARHRPVLGIPEASADPSVRARGSVTVETMVVIPVLVLILMLGIAAGRVTVATAAVEAAARDAAREASIARTAANARTAAARSAAATLRGRGMRCAATSVQVNVAGFASRAGTPATVSASVSCAVLLSDLAGLPGLPGSVVKRAQFASPLDMYRGRQ